MQTGDRLGLGITQEEQDEQQQVEQSKGWCGATLGDGAGGGEASLEQQGRAGEGRVRQGQGQDNLGQGIEQG